MNNYLKDLEFICCEIKSAYEDVIGNEEIRILEKSEFDEVTTIDLSIEKRLIEKINKYGDSKILSEEYNSDKQLSDRVWIIDPIDGTCNFSHGINFYGIQCALFDKGEVVLSAIYFPNTDEMYTALKGLGTWRNGIPVHAANRPVNHAIISFGDFVHSTPKLALLEHKIMEKTARNVQKIRMFGAASIDFSFAASGKIDGNFTFVSNPWDVLPGMLLCKEAGMIITDAYGQPYTVASKTIAVFSTEEVKKSCILADEGVI